MNTIHSNNNNFNARAHYRTVARQFSVIKVHYTTLLFERQSVKTVKPWRKRQNGSFDSSPSCPTLPSRGYTLSPRICETSLQFIITRRAESHLLFRGPLSQSLFFTLPGYTIDSLVTFILSLFPARNLDPDEGSNSFWNRLRGG